MMGPFTCASPGRRTTAFLACTLAFAQADSASVACRVMRAETDVVGIRLDDAASAVKVIGSSEAPGFPEPEPKDGSALPFVCFVKTSYSGYRFPPEIIQQAIWLYLRFTLSLRDVEVLLAERGIAVCYETWVNHFGPVMSLRPRVGVQAVHSLRR